MVQRAACSVETNTFPNGVRISDREGRTSDAVATEASVEQGARSGVHEGRSGGGGNARFSLFKWFKRSSNRESTVDKRRRTVDKCGENDSGRQRSVSSSQESVDTFYSTTTVRSFAFHAGTLGRCDGLSLDILQQAAAEVGPFGAGAAKVAVGNKENELLTDAACTLPANAHSRRRDITARYSLQPSITFNSCGNLPLPDRRLLESLKRLDDRKAAHYNVNSARRRVHVKGKRRAPNPPVTSIKAAEVDARETPRNSSRRKRRAPKPPEKVVESDPCAKKCEARVTDGGMDVETRTDTEDVQTLSNDTLVLQRGVLLPRRELKQNTSEKNARDTSAGTSDAANLQDNQTATTSSVGSLSTAMPRPWYKRSVFEHSRDSAASRRGDVLRGATSSQIEVKEECSATNTTASSASYSMDASLSRLSFFHRGGQAEDRKREAKRKSGLSILTNISELDKEAAAIVQEEQARARASMLLKTSRLADAFERKNEANEELVQGIVTSSIESSSPRRGTRALISKFNAISNITKVTVNASFFARNAKDQQPTKFERDVVRNARAFEHANDWRDQRDFPRLSAQPTGRQADRMEKDISKYFPPQQKAARSKLEGAETTAKASAVKNDRLTTNETFNRISFLQSQLAANRMNDQTPQRQVEMDGKNRSRLEVPRERREREARTSNQESRGHLFPRENKEHTVLNILQQPGRLDKQRFDGVQKEFSDIFDEIDKQLRAKEQKLIDRREARAAATNQRGEVREEEVGISSKVTKVLDILVEAEKDAKTKGSVQPEKSIPLEDASRSADPNGRPKSTAKVRSPPLLNTVEDPITTDLKEMLKEMKHSLPKRSKPGKMATRNADDVTGKPSADHAGKTTYFVSAVTKVENIPLRNDYELDKQKVSCSVQTSGNLRRLNQPSTAQPSTSGWKQENVLYKTSGKKLGSSGLVKNTFQLIRPRDFAEIEATKTTRTNENTYANVIEQSIYANAHVPPSPRQRAAPARSNAAKMAGTSDTSEASPIIERKLGSNEETFEGGEEDKDNDTTEKNMNTLAINRLLRKLEAAIASGHHQQAAGLAKELARLKIHCSVIRQRSARLKDQLIKVNMYIEDKLAHQGPIPLQLPSRMTVAELKAKIHTEFEIPTNVQRWIIGKNLAERDEATLNELQAVNESPIFLYLVAPELRSENVIQVEKDNNANNKEVANVINDNASTSTEVLQIVEEDQEEVEEPQESEERNTPEEVKMDRYEELISLENCDVIPNSEPIECPVCFVTYGPREGVILRDCLHMFCRSCIVNTIRYCEEAEVKCPYRDSEYFCESTLQEREIKALVEPEIYQQHLAKSIAQAENNAGNNAFHCKTPDCPGWCIYDDDVNNFLCPVCGANNCLTCQAIHTGKNCKQYQQELRFSKETDQESRRTAEMLEEMVDRGEALACPTCAVVLMKKWGCDWLRCSMCKTEICWVTRGPRWGPAGKGDTSGGCRCGENGVKCHPRCNYCH